MRKARQKAEYEYPGWNKFNDEGGKAIKGNLIYYIEPDEKTATQYDWFAPKTSAGLTQPGLSRINQSIEAFVYCILGAQVNVRSSILGIGGRVKEAQTEFLTLMEDAIRQPDLAKSVQRYQLAVGQAKVRLNLARSVVDAGENDHQYGKHSRLQQQAHASESRNEARH